MFAFALRDVRNDLLFLARDRFGKKPLFCTVSMESLCSASEMKSILKRCPFRTQAGPRSPCVLFYVLLHTGPTHDFRRHCKLPPGHVLTLKNGRVRESRYWDLSFRPNRGRSEADFIDEIKHRTSEAVAIRLISEVPLGAFLSGGIDSSAVVAFMATASKNPVNTFTIGFSGDTGSLEDERQDARMVAARYGTNHREFEVSPDPAGIIEAIVRSFDEPFADDSTIPSYFVCKIARENVTVALSGLGGDEAFGGYERYLGFQLSQSGSTCCPSQCDQESDPSSTGCRSPGPVETA